MTNEDIINTIDDVLGDAMNAFAALERIKLLNPSLGTGISTRIDLLVHFISFFIANLGNLRQDFVRRRDNEST